MEITNSLKRIVNNRLFITIGLLAIFVLLSYQKFAFYIRFDFNFILLLIALPLIVKRENKVKSIRYGIAAIILLLLYPFLKLSSIYYFAFICTVFFIFEAQYGKLNSIPLFLLIIISPVMFFLTEVLGFEIRLYLSKIAVSVLKLINNDYSYSGNIILIGQNEFHVDTECMGLKMVILSMFITLIFISYQQRKKKGSINALYIIPALIIAYALVIISNLARIILITLFQSAPNSLSHELIGILCFIVYMVVPIWFVVKLIPIRIVYEQPKEEIKLNKAIYFSITAVLLVLFSVYFFINLDSDSSSETENVSLTYFADDYSCSVEEHNVMKLTNKDYLIYIKPASSFYSAEHTPIICWKGSGYKVIKEQVIETEGIKIYYSELQKDKDKLYSCWWYDSGDDKTISQITWRMNNLISGDKYHLVNLLSYDKKLLMRKTQELIRTNIFINSK